MVFWIYAWSRFWNFNIYWHSAIWYITWREISVAVCRLQIMQIAFPSFRKSITSQPWSIILSWGFLCLTWKPRGGPQRTCWSFYSSKAYYRRFSRFVCARRSDVSILSLTLPLAAFIMLHTTCDWRLIVIYKIARCVQISTVNLSMSQFSIAKYELQIQLESISHRKLHRCMLRSRLVRGVDCVLTVS